MSQKVQYAIDELTLGGVPAGHATVYSGLRNDAGLILFGFCTTIPNALAGYAKGCILIKTDAGAGVNSLYENIGTTASCSFNLIGAVAAGEIALAEGNLLIGNASGVATALSAKGNGNVLVGDATTLNSVTPDNAGLVAKSGDQTIAGIKTFSSPPAMSGASLTAGTVLAAALANGAGIATMVSAGLGNSGSYAKTDNGTKTLVAANATKDRGVLVIVTITETFVTNGGGNEQPVVQLGETDTIGKCFDQTKLVDAAAGSVFCFGFLNTSTKAIIATLTAAAGTGAGAFSYVVLALPNS